MCYERSVWKTDVTPEQHLDNMLTNDNPSYDEYHKGLIQIQSYINACSTIYDSERAEDLRADYMRAYKQNKQNCETSTIGAIIAEASS